MSEIRKLARNLRILRALEKRALVGRLAAKGTAGMLEGAGKLLHGAVKRPMLTLGIGGTAIGAQQAGSKGVQQARQVHQATALRRAQTPYGHEGGMF